uniref:WD repeat-containing protein 44 n=1 Tax=Biomphalaria glabrata TaxID=6526 RepID=A0A2C9JF22_BIOGL
MSSGSDQEEFFDAADETPSPPILSGVAPKVVTISDLEEEERRLLQLKRRAEERRRKEDEELDRRLMQLQQQKKSEGSSREQEFHQSEHEGRMKKLEEMRQSIGAEHSFFSSSIDSSLENDSPNTSTDIPDLFALSSVRSVTAPKSRTIEKMENNGTPSNAHRQHAKKRSGSWGDLPKNDTELKIAGGGEGINFSSPDPGNSTSRQSSQLLPEVRTDSDVPCGALDVSVNSETSRLSGSSREEKLNDMDQNMERFLPDKEKQNKSLTLLISGSKGRGDLKTDNVVDTILQQTHVEQDCEPDIVKSTKSRTPPQPMKAPVAPPRKKKPKCQAQAQSQGTDCLEASGFGSQELTPPMFLRGEPPSPKLSRKGKDNALDVKSLLGGNKHIYASDTEQLGSSTSHLQDINIPSGTSCSGSSSPYYVSISGNSSPNYATANIGSAETLDSNLDSLSVQIQHWQSLGDCGREASPNRRPRSQSGRPLSDEEILELVTLKNLDTGETIPLSVAEDKLPKCVNPLALHIMKRTKEYSSDTSLHVDGISDESDSRSEKSAASSSNTVRRKGMKMKKFFGKTVSRVKSMADSALHSDPPVEEEVSVDGKVFKIKSSSKNKGPYDFSQPSLLQELSGDHSGAIWTMKFSPCGKLLATGGQDSILRIWVLKSTYSYFEDFRQKYADMRLSPAVSHDSLNSASSSDLLAAANDPLKELNQQSDDDEINAPFRKTPFCVYKGHTADLLDLSWSKNYFILSSSMDKTVRLWHISRRECLCTFQHIDFVTAIVFHPKDDRYFLSGSLDGKLRLWNIPDKKVTLWNELSGSSNLITTANFCYNGRLAVVGTYDGKCIFYTTEQLKYYTMVNVRSSRGKNSKGRKITGIETMPGEEKILITSNDSRIRLYNLRDLTLSCKYKGSMNNSSQIRASFSPTGKYVVCGSEDHFLYVWKTNHEFIKFSSARRDRNDYWEAMKVHNAVVTAAIFAPNPSFIFRMAEQQNLEQKGQPMSVEDDTEEREIIVSADFTGVIKVITNRPNSRSMFF